MKETIGQQFCMLLKKSPYYTTLEIGVLDIKIIYENISRFKILYNKILVSKFAERIRICSLKKEGFSLLPMDVYRTQNKVQHARSHGKEGVLSRSLLHIFSFSLFFSVSLISRSLRPPETGSLRASLRTLLNSL